jgi:hypothetical protein
VNTLRGVVNSISSVIRVWAGLRIGVKDRFLGRLIGLLALLALLVLLVLLVLLCWQRRE